MNSYAVLFLVFVAGYVCGVWTMAWAQKQRADHEHATEDQARQYEKDFPQ